MRPNSSITENVPLATATATSCASSIFEIEFRLTRCQHTTTSTFERVGLVRFGRKAKLRADPSVPRLLEPQNCAFLPPRALDLPWAFVGVNWMANTADHTTTSTFERVGLVRFARKAKLRADPAVPRLPDRNCSFCCLGLRLAVGLCWSQSHGKYSGSHNNKYIRMYGASAFWTESKTCS